MSKRHAVTTVEYVMRAYRILHDEKYKGRNLYADVGTRCGVLFSEQIVEAIDATDVQLIMTRVANAEARIANGRKPSYEPIECSPEIRKMLPMPRFRYCKGRPDVGKMYAQLRVLWPDEFTRLGEPGPQRALPIESTPVPVDDAPALGECRISMTVRADGLVDWSARTEGGDTDAMGLKPQRALELLRQVIALDIKEKSAEYALLIRGTARPVLRRLDASV